MFRLAFSNDDARTIADRFEAASPLESGVFMLVREAATISGVRFVATTPYFPLDDEWVRQGRDLLEPSPQLLSKMVSRAVSEDAGLLFIHSHPDPRHPTGFSATDNSALDRLARTLPDLIAGPFLAGVVGPNGWVARSWDGRQWEGVDRITSAGREFRILSVEAAPRDEDLDDRQLRALGGLHDTLRMLDVVIVGAGGLGSPLAIPLDQSGVRTIVPIDADRLGPSNLRRLHGARRDHLDEDPPPLKVELVGAAIRASGLGTNVREVALDVRDERALAELLDADVILCCTDTHSSRAYLNAISYAFHLPLIDGGVRIGTTISGSLEALAAEIRIVGPGLPCGSCLGVIDPVRVRQENLSDEERDRQIADGYITGTDVLVPSVGALTMTAAGLMAQALMVMLGDASHLPSAVRFEFRTGIALDVTHGREERCICHQLEGFGRSAV